MRGNHGIDGHLIVSQEIVHPPPRTKILSPLRKGIERLVVTLHQRSTDRHLGLVLIFAVDQPQIALYVGLQLFLREYVNQEAIDLQAPTSEESR